MSETSTGITAPSAIFYLFYSAVPLRAGIGLAVRPNYGDCSHPSCPSAIVSGDSGVLPKALEDPLFCPLHLAPASETSRRLLQFG